MVVMEKINGRMLTFGEPEAAVQKQLHHIMGILHSHKYVHGDFRPNNILYDESKKKLYIIDFDWAGKQGECNYPFGMNTVNITWPNAAEGGLPVTQEHDRYWANLICTGENMVVDPVHTPMDL
jgi:serine/threonine protein kinase